MLVTMEYGSPSATTPGDHHARIERIQHSADTTEDVEPESGTDKSPG